MTVTRRSALALGFGAAAGALAPGFGARAQATPFPAPTLAYPTDALAPHLSQRAVSLHVDLMNSAFNKLNAAVADSDAGDLSLEEVVLAAAEAGEFEIYDIAAQAYNHGFYFAQFDGGASLPGSVLEEALAREFGGLDGFADACVEGAERLFGAGWLWLTAEGDGLYLDALPGAGNPLGTGRQILAGIDVWEHAYMLDYGLDVPGYVRASVLSLINWQAIDQRFMDG